MFSDISKYFYGVLIRCRSDIWDFVRDFASGGCKPRAISLLGISERPWSKTDGECARLYNRHSLRAHLVSAFKCIYSFARLRVASSRQINFHESFVHTVIECAWAPSHPLAPDDNSSGKKNRGSPARQLSFAADDYFRAVESRIREKLEAAQRVRSLGIFINIQRIDPTSDRR